MPYKFSRKPGMLMPQFGVTGVVGSYQPLEENFGDCNVWYDVVTVFAHIERPTWIYQSKYGLIARYTEITSGSYARGFILLLYR